MAAHAQQQPLTIRPGGPLRGEAAIPGDKSISHRSLIFGAMAVGETRITGLLEGEDVLDTARAMRALGATVERLGPGEWRVLGVGVGGFLEPENVIDCGNSGTGVRLLMGAVATHDFATTFTGDASLRGRPMGRVLDPLAGFGATSSGRSGGRLPLTLRGARDPVPVEYRLPVASAQIKSAVLLAGLNTPGETVVIEPEATRDHTERMLRGFGATVIVEPHPQGGRIIRLTGRPELRPCAVDVPRDPSSAAFPVCAALIVEGSEVLVPGIGLNPTRAGLFETLREMGADLRLENERDEGGEPAADLRACFSSLKGVEVPPERAPSMIDEYPILSVVAACASGRTVMRGVGELRVKESDRIAAMEAGLNAAGVRTESDADTFIVHGLGQAPEGGATAVTHLDHRIAMSFAVLGMAARGGMRLDDGAPIATSFPDFLPLMTRLGATIEG